MFKVAVIGGSGLLGRALNDELRRQAGWQIVATAFTRPSSQMVALDVRDSLEVERFIEHQARAMQDAAVAFMRAELER